MTPTKIAIAANTHAVANVGVASGVAGTGALASLVALLTDPAFLASVAHEIRSHDSHADVDRLIWTTVAAIVAYLISILGTLFGRSPVIPDATPKYSGIADAVGMGIASDVIVKGDLCFYDRGLVRKVIGATKDVEADVPRPQPPKAAAASLIAAGTAGKGYPNMNLSGFWVWLKPFLLSGIAAANAALYGQKASIVAEVDALATKDVPTIAALLESKLTFGGLFGNEVKSLVTGYISSKLPALLEIIQTGGPTWFDSFYGDLVAEEKALGLA